MNLLAVDTSTVRSVVGLIIGERRHESVALSGRSHSRDILPTISSLVNDAGVKLSDLSCIAFGQGPGSFTGLRITVGVVQGLAYGLGIPVVPISSLAALAMGEYRRSGTTKLMVALAAREEEIYFGAYQIVDGIPVLRGWEMVVDASKAPQPIDFQADDDDTWAGVGDGWVFRDEIELSTGISMGHLSLDVYPQANDLLDIGIARIKIGETIDAMAARPEYLREQVANVPER
ncbi:MAG: tRNA (adenosine(37)-N6)-threonylcarbamoyltransferase complex dimerization subunit type 1 TsaB [Pseudomonadales bacterium]|jgi:tRNA threonylcarbamoyladenosine biosynthesis protein TsaB